MKKTIGLSATFFILATFILAGSFQVAYAAKGFVVEKGGSDKILITDGYSEYVIEHDYNCYSSDFYDGATIYIDTSYSPSYGDKIIISGYSNTVCEVTSSDDVNIKRYYVDEVFDSEDKIIVTDKNSDRFLVEYGIGCGLSMWRYEGKTIDIDIGGSFLDGIGDRIYLFDSGRDCKVWDAEELSGSGGGSYGGGATYIPPTTATPCPANSSNISGVCTCNAGYITNDSKTSCVSKPTPTCPVNSTLSGSTCVCNSGFVFKNNQCVSYTQDCRLSFGENMLGSAGPSGNSNCDCAVGYQWNSTKTACLISPVSPTVPISPEAIKNSAVDITLPKLESNDFEVSSSDITNFESTGTLISSAAFRKCPTKQCTVIRYYAEESRLTIIGQYKKDEWYEVLGTTDAGGGGGQIKGWVHKSLFKKILETENNLKKENDKTSEITTIQEKPQQNIPWYKKVFGLFSNLFK